MAEIKDFPEKDLSKDKGFIEVCDMLARGVREEKSLVLDFVRNNYFYTIIVRTDTNITKDGY